MATGQRSITTSSYQREFYRAQTQTHTQTIDWSHSIKFWLDLNFRADFVCESYCGIDKISSEQNRKICGIYTINWYLKYLLCQTFFAFIKIYLKTLLWKFVRCFLSVCVWSFRKVDWNWAENGIRNVRHFTFAKFVQNV